MLCKEACKIIIKVAKNAYSPMVSKWIYHQEHISVYYSSKMHKAIKEFTKCAILANSIIAINPETPPVPICGIWMTLNLLEAKKKRFFIQDFWGSWVGKFSTTSN
jgi:hypothetical protein